MTIIRHLAQAAGWATLAALGVLAVAALIIAFTGRED